MKIEEVFSRQRFILMDGAMGTQLQRRGLTPEQIAARAEEAIKAWEKTDER